MVVNDDSIIKYRKRKDKSDYKVKSKEIKDDERGSEKENDNKEIKDSECYTKNIVYINVRGRLCAATPASVISNRTPPHASQKHHFTQNIKSIFA